MIKQRVELLASAVQSAYGAGMINSRERAALQETLAGLKASSVPLSLYMKKLRYLGRVIFSPAFTRASKPIAISHKLSAPKLAALLFNA